MKNNSLQAGFTLRPASPGDLEAIQRVIYAACKAEGYQTMAPALEELAQDWKAPGFSLETDAWVVTDPTGKVVGYELFENRFEHASLRGDGYVDPEYLNLGIGTRLLEELETRARLGIPLAPPDLRVFLRASMGSKEKNAHAIHTEAGFKAIRYAWQMEISFDEEPAPAAWPEKIELRPFDPASHDHIVYQAHEEAFRDHFGHTPVSYETWHAHLSGQPDFNPELWFIAWDGDQVAGFSLCRLQQGIGWVGTLGVRRPWRKHGLGMALLKHSFQQLYKQGYATSGLIVDASNPTGATRLYERAGMHITSEFVTYEKEYRPGREPIEDKA